MAFGCFISWINLCSGALCSIGGNNILLINCTQFDGLRNTGNTAYF
jgi:hypothetical protein